MIVTALTKVLSFSYETATAITLSNSSNNNNNIKQSLLSNKSPCYAAHEFFKVRYYSKI